ncbi:MAG: DUF389 domain-containing protein [Prevotella sp.]|jgi:uncharacterized hydrophobic protein (TIGR00271 family)
MEQQQSLWQVIKGYFNALPDKEDEEETIDEVKKNIVFHGANLWVLIFAIFMASLGLNVNSTAVIIGAMLISPLMGPIIGIGFGVGIKDLELLKRSFKNFAVTTIISVVTATLYFLFTPITEAQSELLARTSPTLYDVLIALCGGAAGFIAITTRGKGNVIPGVAIATALMPPLCTAGYGIAMGNLSYFLGALYLYFINTVFICLATFVGVRMLKFDQKHFVDPVRLQRVKLYIILIVVITMIPATYMTVRIIKGSIAESNVLKFVRTELNFKGTQIISHNLDKDAKSLNIVAVGRTIMPKSIAQATKRMHDYRLQDYKLNIIQGSLSDSTLMSHVLHSVATSAESSNEKLMEQVAEVHRLEDKLNGYAVYETLSGELRGEVKTLWPVVHSLSLFPVVESSMDSVASEHYVVAIAGCRQSLDNATRTRLRHWLKARAQVDSVRLIVTR